MVNILAWHTFLLLLGLSFDLMIYLKLSFCKKKPSTFLDKKTAVTTSYNGFFDIFAEFLGNCGGVCEIFLVITNTLLLPSGNFS